MEPQPAVSEPDAPAAPAAPPVAARAAGPGRWAAWLVVPLVTVPALLLALTIERNAVNIPAWDDWEFVSLLYKQERGELGFADFWVQHNEHRLVVPKAVMLLLAGPSGWDLRLQMVASFVVAALILLLVLWGVRRTLPQRPAAAFVAVGVAAGWIVFSTSQWDNWLWGWQVQWYLNALGMVVVAWALTGRGPLPHPGRRVAAAVGGALLGTFSLASGVLIWIAALPVFLARRELRRHLPAWCLVGGGTIAVYLAGYAKPSYHPPLSAFFEHPGRSLEYILRYNGIPVAASPESALVPGALVLAVLAAGAAYLALRREKAAWVAATPWLALALYGVLTSAMTALGRVGFVGMPPAARYATISMLVVIPGLVVVALVLLNPPGRRTAATLVRVAAVPLAALLVLGFSVNYAEGLGHMENRHQTFVRLRACVLRAASPADPCLPETYPDTTKLWTRIEWLRAHGLGGFPQSRTQPPS